MFKAPAPKSPIVLSYLALPKAVGGIALALPFSVAIPWAVLHHAVQTSISAYYYTGMRNLFVGSLCAIGMFMLSARGYDTLDEIAGIFSAACAIGIAFFPTSPTHQRTLVGDVHYVFAGGLFLTLAFFCLVLFKMTAEHHTVTPQKMQHNRVYTVCGIIILASLALLPTMTLVFHVRYVFAGIAPGIFFETTSLFAFGVAWLVKGETFLRDQAPPYSATRTNRNP
ncbi:MAG: DUF998 domain-containing protein [Candidatus Acidiferrales bacterium]